MRRQYLALVNAGRNTEAEALLGGEASRQFARASEVLNNLQALQERLGAATARDVAARAATTLPLLLGLTLIAILTGLGIGWWVTRSIAGGLAAEIGEGVAALSAATAQITAAVTDQSSGAAEQSAAIAETTATVNE